MLFKQEVYYTDLIESLLVDIASDDSKYLKNFKVKKGTFHVDHLQTHYHCRIQQKKLNVWINWSFVLSASVFYVKNSDHAKRWESKITWQCSEYTAWYKQNIQLVAKQWLCYEE